MDTAQCDLALKFVHDMEFHLKLKHKQVSFKGKWELEPPIEAEGKSLDAYMLDVSHFYYSSLPNSK